ncbi:MAG TPA: preprotein translocase subunit YajC [Gaiellaceae bacterium]|nr:preprotein translocase subunit YajC [Gaiellaceae bacterium]
MIVGASSSGTGFVLIIIFALVFMWLVFMRPQKRRQTQQQRMLGDLRVGDEVLTVGGVYGKITRLEEDEVTVEIAPQVEVRVARRAIAGVTTEPEPEPEPEPEEPAAEEPSAVGGDGSGDENPG